MQVGENDILIVVDVQNDFLPGGSLAVPQGDEVIAPINALAQKIRACDHDAGLAHAASCLVCLDPFRQAPVRNDGLRYGTKCSGRIIACRARAAPRLPSARHPEGELIIRKGYRQDTDSYSAFNEADRRPTGLAGYLKERGFKRVFCAGLATDFCVAWTAQDARGAGFDAVVSKTLRAASTRKARLPPRGTPWESRRTTDYFGGDCVSVPLT